MPSKSGCNGPLIPILKLIVELCDNSTAADVNSSSFVISHKSLSGILDRIASQENVSPVLVQTVLSRRFTETTSLFTVQCASPVLSPWINRPIPPVFGYQKFEL